MEGREASKRKKGVRSTDTGGGGMKEICLDQGVKKKLGLSTEEVQSEISTESNKRKKKRKSNAEEKEGDGEGKKRWDAAVFSTPLACCFHCTPWSRRESGAGKALEEMGQGWNAKTSEAKD